MAEQKLAAGLRTGLEQQLHLSADLRRSLELLALPLPELESRLTAELAVNPMLEENPQYEYSTAENIENLDTPSETGELRDDNDQDEYSSVPEEWHDQLPLPGSASAGEPKNDPFDYIPAPPPQLRSMLLTELTLLPISPQLLFLAAEIVTALNDDGYLTIPLPDLAMTCDAEMFEVEEALKLVQHIAPAGVAARNSAECLQLQLERKNLLTPVFKKLLNEGLEELEKKHFTSLEKKLGVSPEELQDMLKILRTLDPAPGKINSTGAAVIIPDMEISKDKNGKYRAIPQKSNSARIIISPIYEKLVQQENLSADDRKYLNEKLARARELINAVNMRESTLQRIGNLLAERQNDFLDNGIKYLKSMTMREVAQFLDLSESTISRAVSGKFVKTPQGVIPLKFFFSTGFASGSGEDISSQAVTEEIRSIIGNENPAAPLSDDAIAQLLKKKGVMIARRTIAKYRDLLQIPSSSQRKKQKSR